jgi:hypothetical protein
MLTKKNAIVIGVAGAYLLILFVPGGVNLNFNSKANVAFNTPSFLSTNANTTSTFLRYQNPAFNISMLYPINWLKQENGTQSPDSTFTDVVSFSSPAQNRTDRLPANVDIQTDDISDEKNITLAKYANNTSSDIQNSLQNYKLIYSGANNTLTMSGSPAYTFVYTGKYPVSNNNMNNNRTDNNNKNNQISIKGLEVVTIKGLKAYLFNYVAEPTKYSIYLPNTKVMIKSLNFNGKPNT